MKKYFVPVGILVFIVLFDVVLWYAVFVSPVDPFGMSDSSAIVSTPGSFSGTQNGSASSFILAPSPSLGIQ